ncbi:dihydrodipicolinate synthase family protein [Alicyclobacillaceae bacterium I2511]|nr:dihydrodipicolinate synthase family protein [Alicyclobacillaceae bacterium I2511]
MAQINWYEKLQTISAIHVTPFHPETRAIDWAGLEKNVDFLVTNGAQVVVACGNTSEFYSLTLEEARGVIRRVLNTVAGRATVVAGVGYSIDTAIRLGEDAVTAGAQGILIHQPIDPYITDGGAVAYYRGVMAGVQAPSILYFKDPTLSDDVLLAVAEQEELVGVKYAFNDLPRFAAVVRRMPEERRIAWVCGTAEKWAPFFFAAGAKGFTSGLVNVCPELSFALLRALQAENQAAVWRLWERVLPFENLRAKRHNGNNVVVIKEAMNRLGRNVGVTREPVDVLDETDGAELQRILETWEQSGFSGCNLQ